MIEVVKERGSPAWRCPACGEPIRHYEYAPRVGVAYRCTTCRLDLQWDASSGSMTLIRLSTVERRAEITDPPSAVQPCRSDPRRNLRGGRRSPSSAAH